MPERVEWRASRCGLPIASLQAFPLPPQRPCPHPNEVGLLRRQHRRERKLQLVYDAESKIQRAVLPAAGKPTGDLPPEITDPSGELAGAPAERIRGLGDHGAGSTRGFHGHTVSDNSSIRQGISVDLSSNADNRSRLYPRCVARSSRTTSEIVSERAWRVLRSRARVEGKRISLNAVAGAMRPFLGVSQDTIRKRLGRMLNEGAEWPIDYVVAFAAAMKAELLWLEGGPGGPSGPGGGQPAAPTSESKQGQKVRNRA